MSRSAKVVLPLALGIPIGAAVGVVTDQLPLWLGLGVAFGAVGAIIASRRAEA